jgi:hypothetical protein
MQPPHGTTRAEKLQAIAAVFGEEVAARLGPRPAPATDPGADDADRLAWQTNRLIRHLRDSVDGPPAAPQPTSPPAVATPAPAAFQRSRTMPSLAAGEDLAREHPAVIAHMLRPEGQDIRVAVLRALPGQLSREVMRRLKAP